MQRPFSRASRPTGTAYQSHMAAILHGRDDLREAVRQGDYRQGEGLSSRTVMFRHETFKVARDKQSIPAIVQEAAFLDRMTGAGLKIPAFLGFNPEIYMFSMQTYWSATQWKPEIIPFPRIADQVAEVMAGIALAFRPGEAADAIRFRSGRFVPKPGLAERVRSDSFASMKLPEGIEGVIDEFNELAAARPAVVYPADVHGGNLLVEENRPSGLAAMIDFGRMGVGPVELGLVEPLSRTSVDFITPLYNGLARRLSQEANMHDVLVCATAGAAESLCTELRQGGVASPYKKERLVKWSALAGMPKLRGYSFGPGAGQHPS